MDTPRITKAQIANPTIVRSRDEAYQRFREVIAKAAPDYSPNELNERATLWTDTAIKKGAIVVRA